MNKIEDYGMYVKHFICTEHCDYISTYKLGKSESGKILELICPSKIDDNWKVDELGIKGINSFAREHEDRTPMNLDEIAVERDIETERYGISLDCTDKKGNNLSYDTNITFVMVEYLNGEINKSRKFSRIYYENISSYKKDGSKKNPKELLCFHNSIFLEPCQSIRVDIGTPSIDIDTIKFRCGFDLFMSGTKSGDLSLLN